MGSTPASLRHRTRTSNLIMKRNSPKLFPSPGRPRYIPPGCRGLPVFRAVSQGQDKIATKFISWRRHGISQTVVIQDGDLRAVADTPGNEAGPRRNKFRRYLVLSAARTARRFFSESSEPFELSEPSREGQDQIATRFISWRRRGISQTVVIQDGDLRAVADTPGNEAGPRRNKFRRYLVLSAARTARRFFSESSEPFELSEPSREGQDKIATKCISWRRREVSGQATAKRSG